MKAHRIIPFLGLLLLILSLFPSLAQDLPTPTNLSEVRILSPDDIRIYRIDPSLEGFDLFVRRIPGVASIMLTDTTMDLDGIQDNFALRAYDPHPTFANQPRNLNNRSIATADGSYFLLTSTSQRFSGLGDDEWFHIFVPSFVVYGYPRPDSREGQMELVNDFWLNIRTFTNPHATYDLSLEDRGFRDNPYLIRFREPEPPTDTPSILRRFASSTGGSFRDDFTNGGDFVHAMDQVIANLPPEEISRVVFAIDTTVSMRQIMPYIQRTFLPMLLDRLSHLPNLEVGFVLYRDYEDLLRGSYLTLVLGNGFTRDPQVIQRHINSIRTGGGHDIPEAVYEAIETAVHDFDWGDATTRLIIQIGDAPPHPTPKSRIVRRNGRTYTITGPTGPEAAAMAREHNIQVISYLLPPNARF